MESTNRKCKVYRDEEWTIIIFETKETWDIYYGYKTYDLKYMFGLYTKETLEHVEEIVKANLDEYKVGYLEDLLEEMEEI